MIGELGPRSDERGERAGGGQLVGAADIGDHSLADGGAVAFVLDDLHVAAFAGLLRGGRTWALAVEHHEIQLVAMKFKHNLCRRSTTL